MTIQESLSLTEYIVRNENARLACPQIKIVVANVCVVSIHNVIVCINIVLRYIISKYRSIISFPAALYPLIGSLLVAPCNLYIICSAIFAIFGCGCPISFKPFIFVLKQLTLGIKPLKIFTPFYIGKWIFTLKHLL